MSPLHMNPRHVVERATNRARVIRALLGQEQEKRGAQGHSTARERVARAMRRSGLGVATFTCCLVVMGSEGGFAYAEIARQDFYWAHDYCWQTGQLGGSAFECVNPAAPEYLATHMIDNLPGDMNFRQSRLGQYCSYTGLGTTEKREEADVFGTPSPPGSYQMGDGKGNVCAVWAPPDEPVHWGLQLHNIPGSETESNGDTENEIETEPEAEHLCLNPYPSQRCGMERYLALATEAEIDEMTAKDYPFNPAEFRSPALELSGGGEVLSFWPRETGGGWGSLCPVFEDRTSGNIIELCYEQWEGFGSASEGWPWAYNHVAECHSASPEFEHSRDRVVIGSEAPSPLDNSWGEPLEEIDFPVRANMKRTVLASTIEYMANADNQGYKEGPQGYEKPELGYGCGRGSSSSPSSMTPGNWALIGVASGVEEWEAGPKPLKMVDYLPMVWTEFEPYPATITNEGVSAIHEHEATVTAEIDPHGFDTAYYVVYGTGGAKDETRVASLGSGLQPVRVQAWLSGLSPHRRYWFEVVAYREPELITELEEYPYKGEYLTFDTQPMQCVGANIKGLGSTLESPAQHLWTTAFNASANALACSGSQGGGGKPRVEYASTGADADSGACLASFGVNGATPKFSQEVFCGTEEAPNMSEKAEIEGYGLGGEMDSLETVPVAQEALAVIVHLPKDCMASSEITLSDGKVERLGRVAFDQEVINEIYTGAIRTWAEALIAQHGDGDDQLTCREGGQNDPIRPVVPAGRSGSAHIFKEFLAQVHEGGWEAEAFTSVDGERPCTGNHGEDLAAGATETWEVVTEGCENQRWPQAAQVLRASEGGDRGVVNEVNQTESSVGFAGLAVAQEAGYFSSKGLGGENHTGEENREFWAPVQDTKPGSTPVTFADPSTKGDNGKTGEANCKRSIYRAARGVEFPPSSTASDWSKVRAESQSETYAICGLTYDLGFSEYKRYVAGVISATDGREQAITAENYLAYVLQGGQGELKTHEYEALPTEVDEVAEHGVFEMGYEARCEITGCPPGKRRKTEDKRT